MPSDYAHTIINTGDSFAPEQWQKELVLSAIVEIRDAVENWRKVDADPTATWEQQQRARQVLAYRQRDFGGQWKNVEQLLLRLK